jgi:carboxyl-terminal processing protease
MHSFEKFQRLLLTLLIAVGCFAGGFYTGRRGFTFAIRRNPPKIIVANQYPAEQKIDFALFWRVWDIVSQEYLERPVDAQKMMYGAIEGMVSSLGDPYTSFLAPKVNEAVSDALNGNYQGIGAELGLKDGQLIIVSPLDGSPAKAAGLRAGDKILEVGSTSTYGMTISEAVSQIRGPSGTTVSLTVQTDVESPRKISITRGVINIPSITWMDKGDGIAYIRLSRFGGDTNKDWAKAVAEVNVNMKELDAIILDLRGNPGGYMLSAAYIAEEFFRDKPVVYQESATGKQDVIMAKRVGTFDKVPVVYVLIDGGSASASEIVAAALRENIGAKLIGTKSFGKGTIQKAEDFEDGSGIHLTIAKWLTPKKEWVHKVGITPDFVVERSQEDINNNRDPQLDKAIELAKEI